MQWPEAFYQRVQSRLGPDAASFFAKLDTEPVTAVNLHPLKFNAPLTLPEVPWNPKGRILSERPAFFLDPWWHAGAYYPQESGSQLLAAVLQQLPVPEEPLVLDLCAAPGGKSVLISNFLQGRGALLSNEVIRKRVPVLYENLARNGFANNAISNLDPKELGACTDLFDWIFVDAPCSGEGMFRKHAQASEQWSPELVEFCALRQQRILSDIWPALKPGGFLVYSTCTLNETENEDNLRFLLQQADAEAVDMKFPSSWNIESGATQNGQRRLLPGNRPKACLRRCGYCRKTASPGQDQSSSTMAYRISSSATRASQGTACTHECRPCLLVAVSRYSTAWYRTCRNTAGRVDWQQIQTGTGVGT